MVNYIDPVLSALADPTRRAVIEMLAQGPRRPGEIAAEFDISTPAVSRHLKILRLSGLVEEERTLADSRVRTYRLRIAQIKQLQSWISEVEGFWSSQLNAFKAYAEDQSGNSKK